MNESRVKLKLHVTSCKRRIFNLNLGKEHRLNSKKEKKMVHCYQRFIYSPTDAPVSCLKEQY